MQLQLQARRGAAWRTTVCRIRTTWCSPRSRTRRMGVDGWSNSAMNWVGRRAGCHTTSRACANGVSSPRHARRVINAGISASRRATWAVRAPLCRPRSLMDVQHYFFDRLSPKWPHSRRSPTKCWPGSRRRRSGLDACASKVTPLDEAGTVLAVGDHPGLARIESW